MKKLTLILFICGVALGNVYGKDAITQYMSFYGNVTYQGKDVIVLRKFRQFNKTKYFGVEVNSLQTKIIDSSTVKFVLNTWQKLNVIFANSPYIRAINQTNAQSFKLQDAGLIHGYPKEQGVTLTIDLCPSHKPLDREIFTSLISAYANIEQPVPIALSISGKFLLNHPDDINWLSTLEKNGRIRIIWVNHTFSHYYNPKEGLNENFLLRPGADIAFEIMELERALIANGKLPSIFFRFPGLVSDNKIVKVVTGFGLLPIGSDAWLAKGQKTSNGSIVLIHGNGNEPVGVKDFIRLLATNKNLILQKQWLMYDLTESIKNEFK